MHNLLTMVVQVQTETDRQYISFTSRVLDEGDPSEVAIKVVYGL